MIGVGRGDGSCGGRMRTAKSLVRRPARTRPVSHRNAPLSVEGRRCLIARCRHRPIAHVAAEMGISRQCASKWVNRYRRFGELSLIDRPSTPHRQPTATPGQTVSRIESLRRSRTWSANRISLELRVEGVPLARRTVTRHLRRLGLQRRRFLDPTGASNRAPRRGTTSTPSAGRAGGCPPAAKSSATSARRTSEPTTPSTTSACREP